MLTAPLRAYRTSESTCVAWHGRHDVRRCRSGVGGCSGPTDRSSVGEVRQSERGGHRTPPALTTEVLMSTTVETTIDIRPFKVDVPEEELAELRRRIEATRWPSRELVDDRSQGVQLETLQELARYWTTDYDWRKAEAKLNAVPQFTTEIDGVEIHFIHVRSQHEGAMPLIMTHGWPGSVIELLETVGPLTDPTAHGGTAED